VDEDQTLSVSAANGVLKNDTDPEGSPLTASLVGGNPAHAQSFSLSSDGSFSYTPAADFNGSDSYTYQANDGSANSNTASVTITVNPVNDAPSFTAGPDQSAGALDGAQTVAGWATDISPGPSDESGQALTFSISTDNDGAFDVGGLPAIDASGTLTYTPNPLAVSGATANVTVTLKDDGGTANGGVDSSGPQTFTITITP
jgi:hypothetical protein